jgi:hypothetical protein
VTRAARTLAALLALACLAACGGSGAPAAQPAPTAATPARPAARTASRVVTIVLENEELDHVIGDPAAPYLTRLARRGGLATASFGVAHPSLPNYLALTSGSTWGIASDCTDCSIPGPTIADQLATAGLRWRAYAEALPSPCFTGAGAGRYAKRHVPFLYERRLVRDPRACGHVVGFPRLDADLRTRSLPAYALIVPDLCHDMHDCPVRTGDRFLAGLVPRVLRALGPHGLLIVTFDEGDTGAGCCGGSDGGRIATIVAGPDVRPGSDSARPVDQYGVLRTTEQALGLPLLGHAREVRHGSLRPLLARAPRAG